jgi:1-pyrroline-5-carboxylate dehydrogenase
MPPPWRLGGDRSQFNFPLALAGRAGRAALVTGNTGGAARPPATRRGRAACSPTGIRDAGLPAGVFNYVSGSGRDNRRCAGAPSAHRRHHLHRFGRVGMQLLQQMATGPWPAPMHRRDGRQESVHRHRARGPGARRRRHRALGFRHGRAEVLGPVQAICARKRRQRTDRARAGKIAAIRIGDARERGNWLGPVVNTGAYDHYASTSNCSRPVARSW